MMLRTFCLFFITISSSLATTVSSPFWSGSTMSNEPLFFVQEEGAPTATAHLLFKATKDFKLTSPDGTVTYEMDKDYTWQPASDLVTLTAQSRVVFKTHAELFPVKGAPKPAAPKLDGKTMLALYHNQQPLATYTHDESWTGAVGTVAATELARTLAKLRAKQPVKVVMLGDSISRGYNASGFIKIPPLQPPYANLFATHLQETFGSAVTLSNLSVPGRDSLWGISMAPKVIAENPDLVIIAFGMNDRRPAPEFGENTSKIMEGIKAGAPSADFILVSSMEGNPASRAFAPSRFTAYRDVLKTLAGPGVAVADVTSVWEDLLKHKPFNSLTGNGINHPNDFGHRVYADVLTALFPPN